MRVQELMTKKVEACLPKDTLATVGEIMRRRNCGFVPVVDGHITNQVVGVLTDRDVALYLAAMNKTAGQAQARECMVSPVQTVAPDTTLEEAARLMERYAIHRLPVVDGGQLVGILSLKDIAMAIDERLGMREWRQAEQAVTGIIAAIAATR
jgi:CBS domain-containing protein